MKMYILIKDDLIHRQAIVAAAHASLAGYLKFKDTPEVAEWLSGPFYKVVCKVNQTEFERAKEVPDNLIMTESSLDNKEVAIVFKPREEWPRMFNFFRLYK